MSYISPSIANYNDEAPPDDGTETSDNEITWAIIKDELADPIKSYAEAIDSAADTAFGKIAVHANNANGNPNISDTRYQVHLLSASNWHEIGPTGSTNAWSALDGVPSDADWIEVKIYAVSILASPGTSVNVIVYARKSGAGDDANNIDNRIAQSYQAGASGSLATATVTTSKIPIASGTLFDVYYQEVGNAEIELFLTGYGWN